MARPGDLPEVAVALRRRLVGGPSVRAVSTRWGAKLSPLPDFFIGAHAEVEGFTLVTRDPARYRTYFPGVPLIVPAGI
ncbi:MAG: hypothetical protein QM811_15315 [Pirellulales bacterium]